jgi:hypothetical protein
MTARELNQKLAHLLRTWRAEHTTAASGVINARFIYLGRAEYHAFIQAASARTIRREMAGTPVTYESAEVILVDKPSHLAVGS